MFNYFFQTKLAKEQIIPLAFWKYVDFSDFLCFLLKKDFIGRKEIPISFNSCNIDTLDVIVRQFQLRNTN